MLTVRPSVGQERLAGLVLSKRLASVLQPCSLLQSSPRSLTTLVDDKGTTTNSISETTASAPSSTTNEQGIDETLKPQSTAMKKNDTESLFLRNIGLSKGTSTLLPCSFSLNILTDQQKYSSATAVASTSESLTAVASKQTEIPDNEFDARKIQPVASNHLDFQQGFRAAMVPRPTTRSASKNERRAPKKITWGDHIAKKGVKVTRIPWVHIYDVSPNSSLEAMMDAVENVLDKELERGIVNLDAPFVPHTAAPLLKITDEQRAIRKREQPHPYIVEAKLILSPFARPTGWYVRLAHRSLAQALLVKSRNSKNFSIAHKLVKVKEYRPAKNGPQFEGFIPGISDATIRVENCPDHLPKLAFLNLFSRFDLSMTTESVVSWKGVTPKGKEASSQTYLVHFADPSWARAAIRERQGAEVSGMSLRLVQFPRQLLREKKI